MTDCTVYVSIGNTDGRLSQARWSKFWRDVDHAIRSRSIVVHGAWVSESTSSYQNACWAFVPHRYVMDPGGIERALRDRLAVLARDYQQEAITWASTPVEFIGPADPVEGAAMGRAIAEAENRRAEADLREHVKHLPRDWEHIYHLRIHDADGWSDGQPWDFPINEDEWIRRSNASTVDSRPDEHDPSFTHNPWDGQCTRHLLREPVHPRARCRTCRPMPEDGPRG